MRAYFCCAGGPTSQYYAAVCRKMLNEDGILVEYLNVGEPKRKRGELDQYHTLFFTGTAMSANKYFFESNDFEHMDYVYLMPQAAYNLPKFKEFLDPINVPCRALSVKEAQKIMVNEKKAAEVFPELIELYNKEHSTNLVPFSNCSKERIKFVR